MTSFDSKMAQMGFKIKATPTNKPNQESLYFHNEREMEEVTKGTGLKWRSETLAANQVFSSVREFEDVIWHE